METIGRVCGSGLLRFIGRLSGLAAWAALGFRAVWGFGFRLWDVGLWV